MAADTGQREKKDIIWSKTRVLTTDKSLEAIA